VQQTSAIVDIGIDYISMSLKVGERNYQEWLGNGTSVLLAVSQEGNEIRQGTFQGYEGIFCAGLFCGSREDGAHIHIPGSRANDYFNQLFHPTANYSRLDIQTTVKVEPFDLEYAKHLSTLAEIANNQLPENRRRKVLLMTDNGGGRTCYIGKRTSPVFCRAYNKEATSTEECYTHCWRFEVELHNHIAKKVAHLLHSVNGKIYAHIASMVWQTYRDRGIEPPYTKDMENAALPIMKTIESDVDKRLRWLSEQVRPTVQRLLAAGYGDIVMESLGLSDRLPVENSSTALEGDYDG